MTKSRTHSKTHPWISFQLDLRKVSHELWLQLGEAQAKCEHVSGAPLLPAVAESLHSIFLAKGARATTAIEGNTLSEDQALQIVEGTLSLPPSKEYLRQEIENIIDACNLIKNRVMAGEHTMLSVEQIQEFNALVLTNLPLPEDVHPGEIRRNTVRVGGYKGAPPEDCKFLLEQLCNWLNNFPPLGQKNEIVTGILKAVLAHLYLAWIHPFGDGNGRTARLIEFQILLSSGVPSTSAQLLSNHYNETRTEYYRQLDYASKSGGDVLPLINYALQGFIDELTEQIKMIEAQQIHVHWINYVYDQFRDKERQSDIRRRRLVLDLISKAKPVPSSEIRYISTRMAEAYAGKTDKTIQRDIDGLIEMGLVRRAKDGIKVNRELMLAFLPDVADT